jgi:hypothetical protein
MTTTLLLDVDVWDLVLDVTGNIAVASDPYSQAQDAASAIRTFSGECIYDTTLGVPYWNQILGQAVPLGLLKSYFTTAALTVPGTAKAVCYISKFEGRTVTGQVQFTSSTGQTGTVTI